MKLVILWIALATQLAAQIPGNPRFHRGDDPRWADPAFDDRAWERVGNRSAFSMADLAFNRQWIRLDVDVPPGRSELVVAFCVCEFFLNGVRVGATADLDATKPAVNWALTALPIPEGIPAGPAVLAIREYAPPGTEAAFAPSLRAAGSGRYRLVPASQAANVLLTSQRTFDLASTPAILMLVVLTMLVGSVDFRRGDGVAALLCVYLVSQILATLCSIGGLVNGTSLVLGGIFSIPNLPSVLGSMILASRLRPPVVLVASYLALHCLSRAVWVTDQLRADPAPWTPWVCMIYIYVQPVVTALAGLWITAIAWRPPHAPKLLLLAGLLTVSLHFSGRLGGALLDRFGNVAFAFAGASWAIGQERRRRAEELRLKGEMEAAKSVQTLLLGQGLPNGVEAVYIPASEVGGDLYQAFDTPRGTLILVGDVSGKGSSAAMTAAAITGAARALCHHGPARILAELNSVLRSHSGFVTCCCALVEKDALRAASAGHPAPYADGQELELAAGLPLGMVADAEYQESSFPLPRVLTLVSDGVIEAANTKGELFGFDRTREISMKPAQEIADTAKQWGQNDDITVVTVRRTIA